MAFERERDLWIKTIGATSAQQRLLSVASQACFAQILLEDRAYDPEIQRKLLWDWTRATVPDRYVADSLAQTFWKVASRLDELFVPTVSPQKAATTAVIEHLRVMSEMTPVPIASEIRWVSLEDWYQYKDAIHVTWRARYDAAFAELREHSDDAMDLWRQLAFAHLQNISEPRYSAAYKWLRPIWTQALWEVLNGVSGPWQSLLRVVGWGYLPVGLAADGKTFIVSSRSLP